MICITLTQVKITITLSSVSHILHCCSDRKGWDVEYSFTGRGLRMLHICSDLAAAAIGHQMWHGLSKNTRNNYSLSNCE